MIAMSETTRRGVSEQCRCCQSNVDTMRITFSMDGTAGTSVVLCGKCRKELIKALESEAEE